MTKGHGRRGRRAKPEPDSDPGVPAGTGFADPGGTASAPSGYGPGAAASPAREIGEIAAFQPPAPQAPAAFQPTAAPEPPSPSGYLPPGPIGEDRGFGLPDAPTGPQGFSGAGTRDRHDTASGWLPDAPTGPQGFSGAGTRDRQDTASGWPGGSTGTAGEAPARHLADARQRRMALRGCAAQHRRLARRRLARQPDHRLARRPRRLTRPALRGGRAR